MIPATPSLVDRFLDLLTEAVAREIEVNRGRGNERRKSGAAPGQSPKENTSNAPALEPREKRNASALPDLTLTP
jgi:hypothetical protein